MSNSGENGKKVGGCTFHYLKRHQNSLKAPVFKPNTIKISQNVPGIVSISDFKPKISIKKYTPPLFALFLQN